MTDGLAALLLKLAHVGLAFLLVAGLLGRWWILLTRAARERRRGARRALLAGGRVAVRADRADRSSPLVVLVGLVTAWAQGYPWLGLTTGWMLLTVLLIAPDPRALIPLIFLPRGRVFEAEMATRGRGRGHARAARGLGRPGRRDGPALRARVRW